MMEMNEKDADIEAIAERVPGEAGLLSELLEGLKEKNETIRYNCYKVLMELTRECGELLYSYWDFFVDQMDRDNTYHKLSAAQLIARLCKVDKEGRFDSIFDEYFALLGDKGTVLAAHVALSAGRIATAKPHLREKITGLLLDIDGIYRGKQLEMTKAYVIEAFGEYFDEAENKDAILDFVRNQLDSTSPKTRKLARAFLEEHS